MGPAASLELPDLVGEGVRALLQPLDALAEALLRGEDRLLPVTPRVREPLVGPSTERSQADLQVLLRK